MHRYRDNHCVLHARGSTTSILGVEVANDNRG